MRERPNDEGSGSLTDEPNCPVCGAVSRYCPGHAVQPHDKPMMSRTGGKWGQFMGDPVAKWNADGVHMELMEDFTYIDQRQTIWTAKKGAVIDGASIPRPFWRLVGSPLRGKYRYASVIHDYYCVIQSEVWEAVHYMFYEACMAGGTRHTHAKILYYAVRHFGPKWGDHLQSSRMAPETLSDEQLVEIERWISGGILSLHEINNAAPKSFGIQG